VMVDEEARAYPFKAVMDAGEITDTLGGKMLRVTYDKVLNSVAVKSADGSPVLSMRMYWVVWKGCHRRTTVYGIASEPETPESPASEPPPALAKPGEESFTPGMMPKGGLQLPLAPGTKGR
jgi:hypothetical protein